MTDINKIFVHYKITNLTLKEFLVLFFKLDPEQKKRTLSGFKQIFAIEYGPEKEKFEQKTKKTVEQIMKGEIKSPPKITVQTKELNLEQKELLESTLSLSDKWDELSENEKKDVLKLMERLIQYPDLSGGIEVN